MEKTTYNLDGIGLGMYSEATIKTGLASRKGDWHDMAIVEVRANIGDAIHPSYGRVRRSTELKRSESGLLESTPKNQQSLHNLVKRTVTAVYDNLLAEKDIPSREKDRVQDVVGLLLEKELGRKTDIDVPHYVRLKVEPLEESVEKIIKTRKTKTEYFGSYRG